MDSLTLRVDQKRIVISRDDGSSVCINNGESTHDLMEQIDILCSSSFFSFDISTAAAIGSMAESCLIQPRNLNKVVSSTDNYGDGYRIKLAPLATTVSSPLKNVLERRKSERSFGAMSLESLSAVLVRSGRVLEWSDSADGYQISHRPAPSAGARHPIEMKIIALDVAGIETGLWNFDPAKCELVKAEIAATDLISTIDMIREAGHIEMGPAAVVLLVAHFDRTLSRYPNGATLVWRDAGVMASLLHLCATDIGLASCIVGTCGILNFDSDHTADICSVTLGSLPN